MCVKLSKADESNSFLLKNNKRFEGGQICITPCGLSQHMTDVERSVYSTAGLVFPGVHIVES